MYVHLASPNLVPYVQICAIDFCGQIACVALPFQHLHVLRLPGSEGKGNQSRYLPTDHQDAGW
jgi:hypothetical protein